MAEDYVRKNSRRLFWKDKPVNFSKNETAILWEFCVTIAAKSQGDSSSNTESGNPNFIIWMAILIGNLKITKIWMMKNCCWTQTTTSYKTSQMYFWHFVSSSATKELLRKWSTQVQTQNNADVFQGRSNDNLQPKNGQPKRLGNCKKQRQNLYEG